MWRDLTWSPRQLPWRVVAVVVLTAALVAIVTLASQPTNQVKLGPTLRLAAPSLSPTTTTSTSLPLITTTTEQPSAAVATPNGTGSGHGSNGNGEALPPPPPPTTTPTTQPPPAPTTTTTQPPPAEANCGGSQPGIAPSGESSWTCTFDDEFANDAALDPTKWTVETTANTGYYDGHDCYLDTPNNVSVSGGTLNLTLRQEATPFTCIDPQGNYTTQYSSGSVYTLGHFSQTYGLFEVRAKFPTATVPGLESTLWLWPVNEKKYGLVWPQSGEIDFSEWYSQYPTLDIPYIHYVSSSLTPHDSANCALANPDQFHTYGVEWTPSSMTLLLDGNTCFVDSWTPAFPLVKPAPFDQPFFIVLTQAIGQGTNVFTPGSTPLPATTQIQWVRVWS